MRKIYLNFLLLSLFYISSCTPIMSPSIEYENSSPKGEVVKNIDVVWNGHPLLRTSNVEVCGSGGAQVYYLKKESDFFGSIHIEWENANGKKLTKDIVFKKEDFPAFKRSQFGSHIYHYVVLYFTQEDVEIYTSDNPNIKKIRKEKGGDWMISYVKGRGQVCIEDAKMKWGNPRTSSYQVDKNGKRIEED